MLVENSLKRFSVNTSEVYRLIQLPPDKRRNTLKQNLEAYTYEVVQDKPVSILYYYWFNSQGNIFTDPSLKPIYNLENQIDNRERGGLPKIGIYRTLNLARENPDRLVFWYSPPGPASFDDHPDNPYTHINFDYGQLYVNYYDGEKINSIAIKTSKEGEGFLRSIFDNTYYELTDTDPKIEITNFLTRPKLSNFTIDDLINQNWDKDVIIYHNQKRGTTYGTYEVIQDLKNAFLGKNLTPINLDQTLRALEDQAITEEKILQAYVSVIHNYMKSNNLSSLALGGSCGGGTASLKDIESLLGISHNIFSNPLEKLVSGFSTGFRMITKSEKWEYHEGKCVVCEKDPAKIGPCNICIICEKKFNQNN